MNQDFNGFDSIIGIADPEEQLKRQKQDEQQWTKLDYLIHKTFKQNESGAELLSLWKESLVMTPTVTPHSTQFDAGINEGMKTFIRNILLTIEKVEADK